MDLLGAVPYLFPVEVVGGGGRAPLERRLGGGGRVQRARALARARVARRALRPLAAARVQHARPTPALGRARAHYRAPHVLLLF